MTYPFFVNRNLRGPKLCHLQCWSAVCKTTYLSFILYPLVMNSYLQHTWQVFLVSIKGCTYQNKNAFLMFEYVANFYVNFRPSWEPIFQAPSDRPTSASVSARRFGHSSSWFRYSARQWTACGATQGASAGDVDVGVEEVGPPSSDVCNDGWCDSAKGGLTVWCLGNDRPPRSFVRNEGFLAKTPYLNM